MSEQIGCALPKNESTWTGGVVMKDEDTPNLKDEVRRFQRLLREIPEPNCGRIEELKEKIRNQTLLTKEAIYEAAERIAEIFFKKG